MIAVWLLKVFGMENKKYAFFTAFFYSLIGIVSAALIFPKEGGLMAIAFASILCIPPLAKLLRKSANHEELQAKKLALLRLIRSQADIFQLYFFIFLGVLAAYSLATFVLPLSLIQGLFTTQINIMNYIAGNTLSEFLAVITLNNLIVFSIAFFISMIYGGGGVLFLIWNASVWGVVITFFIKEIATGEGVVVLVQQAISFLPHLITEATAYIGAAIVGGVVAKAVLRERLFSVRFNRVLTKAAIFFVLGMILTFIASFIEVMLFFS